MREAAAEREAAVVGVVTERATRAVAAGDADALKSVAPMLRGLAPAQRKRLADALEDLPEVRRRDADGALRDGLGAPLDGSLDPMTVVARGAALYASTLERAGGAALMGPPGSRSKVVVQLAHERASGTLQSPVAGTMDPASGVHEVKVDAAGGFWTGGWVEVVGGAFSLDVMLQTGRSATTYRLSARDRAGNAVAVEPAEFTIAFMLPIGAPPLPHTIAVELTSAHGATTYDRLFERHCPLPAETRKQYKAERTLRPSEVGSTLPIKFWEIDVSDDPAERWWSGCVHVRAAEVRRPIPEGSELELIVKIDSSRKMAIEVYVPLLDQSFTRDVYVPDPPSARAELQQQLDLCFARLEHLRQTIHGGERDDLAEEFAQLEQFAEDVAERVERDRRAAERAADVDAALGATDALRKLRVQIARLEERRDVQSGALMLARTLRWRVPDVGRNVETYGTEAERAEFARLSAQYERYAALNDARGLQWVNAAILAVNWMAVREQMPYWQQCLRELESTSQRFVNKEQAEKALAEAQAAEGRGDLAGLRTTVQRGWRLQQPDQVEASRDQAAQSGLRG